MLLRPCERNDITTSLPYSSYAEPSAMPFAAQVVLLLVFLWTVFSLCKNPMPSPHAKWDPVYLPAHTIAASARLVQDALSGGSGDGTVSLKTKAKVLQLPAELASAPVVCFDAVTDDYKSIDEAEKERVDEKARRFLEATPDAVVMIYAAWCPRCKAKASAFAQAAKDSRGPAKFAMFHAEAMKRTSFGGGDGSIHALQYFPTILKKSGGGALTETSLEDVVAAKAAAPAASARRAETVPPAEDPFADLF